MHFYGKPCSAHIIFAGFDESSKQFQSIYSDFTKTLYEYLQTEW